MFRRPTWCLLLLLSACGGPPPLPDGDLVLQVTADAAQVDFGKSFPLTVLRVWNRDLVPAVWEDDALAPLRLELERTTTREDDARVAETRVYRAWAFERGGVALPAIAFRARPRAGGAEVETTSEPLRLDVASAIGAEDAGDPELPGEPWPAPTPWAQWIGGAALLLVLVAVARARRKRPAPPSVSGPEPARSPADDARARLATLRGVDPVDHEQRQRWFGELDATLRAFLAARLDTDPTVKSTEELTALVEDGATLASVLGPCDLARFARGVPSAADRAALLDRAETFLEQAA